MIFSHLPKASLLAIIKNYDILLYFGCKNSENVIRHREDCLKTLEMYDLHKEK